MKYTSTIGTAAGILLVIACFLPWAYYPDLGKNFTGFFSQSNAYGKPGAFLVPMVCIAIALFFIPKIWAKRLNFFVGAMILAYTIKSVVLFSSCYRGICPEKRIGLYLAAFASVIVFVMVFLPDLRLESKEDNTPSGSQGQ